MMLSNSLSTDPVSGEKHLRHNMSADGFYKGRLVKDLKKKPKNLKKKSAINSYEFSFLFPGQGFSILECSKSTLRSS